MNQFGNQIIAIRHCITDCEHLRLRELDADHDRAVFELQEQIDQLEAAANTIRKYAALRGAMAALLEGEFHP